MIASLHGRIKAVRESALIVDVGGVGYEVRVPDRLLSECGGPGEIVELYTRMLVRENEVALYGFRSLKELDLFVMLNGVTGIGPRLALAVLSIFDPESLRDAILRGDAPALAQVSGIGQKTAQRVVLDLEDRLAACAGAWVPAAVSSANADVINALTALGYSLAEAQSALNALPADAQDLDERILAALRYLGSS